ncbi:histone-lysine N-methyltransferase SETMAR-like [Saccostrea cucullata]|uniref:histone-lysine N-methyltransferase SETMAR-like n=1 Tax=Saccostrea cuccullata TaxID=36930 RepID=UPI002ED28265
MVGKRVENIEEIRAYIKVRTTLNNSVKQIFTELGEVYGSDKVSYETVRRWRQKFLTGTESIKDAAKSGLPVTVSGKTNVSKVKEIIESDGRYTIRDIAKAVGISRVHFILKRILKVRKISARWIPHTLTDDQKKVRIQTAKRLLKMFPNFNQRQFANIVTGDETGVHYFEPVRKVGNKLWLTKHGRRPVVAKRTMSIKNVLYCIFLSCDVLAVQIPVPKGKRVTGRYYRDVVLKKLKKYQKRRPVSGFRHVRLLYDNAPSHTSELVKQFLKSEKVTVLPHPPYSPDLAPCDFFLFPKLKKFLSGRRYKSRQALGSVVSQCLRGYT